ncbi:AsmA family protein [Gluconacetobacter takamatsuzukensis]|uniref:AsmA family protein n=1 Tax=Gluconacetobacter takamatsuzukensis TaxID=1286190 RepID=UPI001FED06F1|nr:AsmA family protein [Gluconacetobacter takamatsuzukensis]
MTTQRGTPTHPSPARRIPVILAGVLALAIVLLIVLWNWDWFVPLIERRASAALHRPVTVAHLHVRPGWTTTITLDDPHIGQPDGFTSEKEEFASARSLTVAVKPWPYLVGRGLVLPLVALDAPRGDIVALKDGRSNYSFTADGKPAPDSGAGPGLPAIGELRITDGDIRVALARLRSDFRLAMHTTPPADGKQGTIVAEAKGRYAAQPIIGHFVGGALLTLADVRNPYPVDLHVANGPTSVTLRGTVDDPIHFAGAHLNLTLAGPDMSLLYPLTGIPIPQTPRYSVAGKLDYTEARIRFTGFEGHLGSSDIGGDISVDPHQKVPFVEAGLHSHLVDLADLAGFVGGEPGHAKTESAADSNVLPDQRINVPKLNAVNAHIAYHGDHIENKRVPLDNIDVDATVQDGAIDVHKLNFAVGSGTLASAATLNPAANDDFSTRFRLDVSRVPVTRLMKGAGSLEGQGTIGGHVTLAATGHSVADLVAHGTGGITLVLDQGGHLSAILPDLLGLQLGNAILSALGLPDRTPLQCFIADMPLKDGILSTHSFLIQTGDTRTTGDGTVNFRDNTLDYAITTRAVHFTVASFPGAVHITGPLRSPTILPGAEIAGRLAATGALAAVFPPAAIIPTIQFGVGKGSVCEQAVEQANANPAAGIAPGATTGPHPSAAAKAGRARATRRDAGKSAAQVRAAWERKQQQNGH